MFLPWEFVYMKPVYICRSSLMLNESDGLLCVSVPLLLPSWLFALLSKSEGNGFCETCFQCSCWKPSWLVIKQVDVAMVLSCLLFCFMIRLCPKNLSLKDNRSVFCFNRSYREHIWGCCSLFFLPSLLLLPSFPDTVFRFFHSHPPTPLVNLFFAAGMQWIWIKLLLRKVSCLLIFLFIGVRCCSNSRKCLFAFSDCSRGSCFAKRTERALAVAVARKGLWKLLLISQFCVQFLKLFEDYERHHNHLNIEV